MVSRRVPRQPALMASESAPIGACIGAAARVARPGSSQAPVPRFAVSVSSTAGTSGRFGVSGAPANAAAMSGGGVGSGWWPLRRLER